MGDVGNCPECGKLYMRTAIGMCSACYVIEEENQLKVAEYVRDHPKSSVDAIHEATGIKEKTIFRMIKSGRFIDMGRISYPCQQCAAPIYDGRICAQCNDKFLKQVKEAEAKRAGEKKAKEAEDTQRRSHGMYTKGM